MPWLVFTTEEFDKDFQKLDSSIQNQIRKEISQLKENPYVGKPLGFRFFREKKVMSYRFYYLVYETLVVVFVIALSNKKSQEKTIQSIKAILPEYNEEITKRLNQLMPKP